MSNMFYTLSASLAQATGEDEVLCRGVLRMTIINSAPHLRQITDPVESTTAIMTHMTKMTYHDWKTLIEGPAFSRMLGRIGIKEPSTVKTELIQTLVEQQSLFTMGAR
jgi:hypothetical protein